MRDSRHAACGSPCSRRKRPTRLSFRSARSALATVCSCALPCGRSFSASFSTVAALRIRLGPTLLRRHVAKGSSALSSFGLAVRRGAATASVENSSRSDATPSYTVRPDSTGQPKKRANPAGRHCGHARTPLGSAGCGGQQARAERNSAPWANIVPSPPQPHSSAKASGVHQEVSASTSSASRRDIALIASQVQSISLKDMMRLPTPS
jgi:hypothetical protein